MALPDLVQAKKTQRDKDWPMVRRLLEAHFFENRDHATAGPIRFWLRELRTPELLIEAAQQWPKAAVAQAHHRKGVPMLVTGRRCGPRSSGFAWLGRAGRSRLRARMEPVTG